MTERPRILLLIPHLGGGGAERVTALLAQGLSVEKYELHLGLMTGLIPQQDSVAELLLAHIKIHALGARRVRAGAFRLLRLVRRLKPDVILSGMAHLNFLVLLLRPFFPRATRVLVRQNATVSAALASCVLPSYTRLLYQMLYRHADRVICQTSAMAVDLASEVGISAERLVVLPNPIDLASIRSVPQDTANPWARLGANTRGPHLLAIGRLSREKGFDLLLRAMVTVRERFPKVSLAIAGAGPEEAKLKNLSRDLGLESAVLFPGHLEQPSSLFPGASLFVLTSRHEGLPNALLEAAGGGLPLVALPASEGLVDLLRGQPGVWLANEITAAALADSLLAALDALSPRQRFPHPFVNLFSLDRSIRAYEDLIEATLREYSL